MVRARFLFFTVCVAISVAGSFALAEEEPSLTGQYPVAALEQGLAGTVGLDCTIREERRIDCVVLSEMPGNQGFADAALVMSRAWQLPEDDTALGPGTRFQRTVQFLPGQEPVIRSIAGRVNLPWERRPPGTDYARFLPDRVFERSIDGGAVLECVVNTERALDCEVAEESPAGEGFGAAALRFVAAYRIAPQLSTGESTIGGRIRLPISLNVN